MPRADTESTKCMANVDFACDSRAAGLGAGFDGVFAATGVSDAILPELGMR